MLEGLITLGYLFGALGFVGCVIAYFVAPKMIKMLAHTDEEDKDQ